MTPRAWQASEIRALGLHTDVVTAASILGIGRSTAYDLIRRGEFPVSVLHVGSRLKIPTQALLEFLRQPSDDATAGNDR